MKYPARFLARRASLKPRNLAEWLILSATVGLLWVSLWPSPSHFIERLKVADALEFLHQGQQALASACTNGVLAAKPTLGDLGLPEADPAAQVLRAELRWTAPDTVRFRVVMQGVGAIRAGSMLEYELVCPSGQPFSARFVGATVEQAYLPPSLRER